jgi:hypothetical protein
MVHLQVIVVDEVRRLRASVARVHGFFGFPSSPRVFVKHCGGMYATRLRSRFTCMKPGEAARRLPTGSADAADVVTTALSCATAESCRPPGSHASAAQKAASMGIAMRRRIDAFFRQWGRRDGLPSYTGGREGFASSL